MTLEETIKRYSNNAEYERTHGSLQGCLEFKQLADWLKELKQLREQEPCVDCISRQAVLEAFNLSEKTRKYGGDHSGYDTMMLYEIQDVIEDLPSIQQKPKTDVLDKIRTEIKEVQTYKMFEGEDTVYVERNDVFKIIDKYKAESEDKK